MATEATVDRRAAIVRAAYELVAEHGLGGLTHRRTAERAGVALGLTTYYFGSADELAGAALEHAAALAGEGLHSWAERIRATDDLPGTLAELILDRIDDRLRAVADLELQLAAAHRPGLRPLPLARIEGLAAVLAGRVGTDAARAAVAYVDGTVLTALVTGERPDRDAPAAALAALLDVRPETGRRRRPPGRDRTVEQVIGDEVRRIRQASGATLAEMAVRTGISKPMLSKIENAQTSCSLTTLARLADALDVPVTSLFRDADTPREAVFTPAGAGARIVARGTRVGHDYTLLGALRGPHKRMEAHLVTLTEHSEEFPLFQHPGTELLYMLEGRMVYGHGETGYTMAPGDALQLDGEGTHGPRELLELPIRFLSVVAHDGEVSGTAVRPGAR